MVNFFSLLSHTQETGARKMSITQELLSLVTGLAHYLKILIRIALTAALKLERDHGNLTAIGYFLSRLDRLARDPEASKFASLVTAGPSSDGEVVAWPRVYGYKGLTRAVGTLVGQGEATTDLCEGCKLTVEEECARFGTSLRWHLPCLRCVACHKTARKERELELPIEVGEAPTAYYKDFRIEPITAMDDGRGGTKLRGGSTFCSSCTPEGTRDGCEYVTRLEQYAFLLCVALNKLYALLKQRGAVPSSPGQSHLFILSRVVIVMLSLRSRQRRVDGRRRRAISLRCLSRLCRHQTTQVCQPRPQAVVDDCPDPSPLDCHSVAVRTRRSTHRLLLLLHSSPLRKAPDTFEEGPTPRRLGTWYHSPPSITTVNPSPELQVSPERDDARGASPILPACDNRRPYRR